MTPLRELDARLVPALAGGLQRASRRVRRAAVLATGVPAMRRLDARYATSGPLGFVRDVPQVGVLVIAAVFVAGGLSAGHLHSERTPVSAVADAGSLVLGPAAGQDASRWSASAHDRLVTTATARPGARYLALVVFTAYRPVADAQLGPDVAIRRAYLRAPAVEMAEVQDVPVPELDNAARLSDACAAAATRMGSDAQDLRQLASTIDSAEPALGQQKDDLTKQAAREDAEAAAYRDPCRTLFAVLVEADAGRLRALLDREGVRGVELARAGASLAAVQVRPLLPEVTGVVPTTAP